MIITTIEELRLASPAHAIDSIDGLVGFIDNSEHDFLEDKLGTPLYDALCQWYAENNVARSTVADYQTGCWNRLLLMAQRVVAFDALGRYAGVQGVSLNNAGINQMATDDYPKADRNTVSDYRDTCAKEAHTSLNLMLRQLEQWCKLSTENTENTESTEPTSSVPSAISVASEKQEIVALWKQSRYYYLAATLLIPSCETLQAYLDISESREKFIRMLPELQFIQEEIIGNSIGEDLLKVVIDFARDGKLPDSVSGGSPAGIPAASLTEPTLSRLLHRLRKVMVALLIGRTSVLKYTKEQKIQAHDDGVRMLQNVMEYLKSLVPPEPAPAPTDKKPAEASPLCCNTTAAHASAACWTPPLF